MNRRALQKIQLDRRLVGRRGWIAPDVLARELEKLPDVADKIGRPEESKDGSDDARSADSGTP
jgi:hypothetical protein